MVFDTETTTDVTQRLIFGSAAIYERDQLIERIIFHADDLDPGLVRVLKKYCDDHPELKIDLRSRQDFVQNVFIPETVGADTMVAGYNLPFDLSRIALRSSDSSVDNEAFSFVLHEDRRNPRIRVKSLDSKRALIGFAGIMPDNKGNNRGRTGKSRHGEGKFVDLRTIAYSLTGESHSLASACMNWGVDGQKIEAKEHGKVTPEYIEYNLNDVEITHQLYLRLREEYGRFHLSKDLHKVLSAATLGKSHLEEMGVLPFFIKNPEFPDELIGRLMCTYYGGRSEIRIRKEEREVQLIDFLSMYPTVCILCNTWAFMIADHIEQEDCTEAAIEFLKRVDLELLRQGSTWKDMYIICQVQPQEDILPLRCQYRDQGAYNIGLNFVSSETPFWYTMADLVASKLLTGKAPKVLKAVRFTVHGVQSGLKPIEVIGGQTVDPVKDDFFLALMTHRDDVKRKMKLAQDGEEKRRLHAEQNGIKTILNATSYGINVEMHPADGHASKCYGHEGERDTDLDRYEKPGFFFNPVLAPFITAGARLMLAITERLLKDKGAWYAFCDTDSMAVPHEQVAAIQAYFQKLSPYSFDDPLFKLEKENFAEDGKTPIALYFYGISTKRYVLYNKVDGKLVIRKYSAHGLGHLLNPFGPKGKGDWMRQLWMDILLLNKGEKSQEEIDENYSTCYAISQMTLSKPNLMKPFDKLNQVRGDNEKVQPFSFFLVGVGNHYNKRNGQMVKPMAHYSKEAQLAVHEAFIDYNSGEVLSGEEYWKPMNEVFRAYADHTEDKFDGREGVLERKHLQITHVRLIGKEANDIDIVQHLGLQEDSYLEMHGRLFWQSPDFATALQETNSHEAELIGISRVERLRMMEKLKLGLCPFSQRGIARKARKLLNMWRKTHGAGDGGHQHP